MSGSPGSVLRLVQSGEQVQVERIMSVLHPGLITITEISLSSVGCTIWSHRDVGGNVEILSKLVWNPFLTRIVSTPDSLNISFNFL